MGKYARSSSKTVKPAMRRTKSPSERKALRAKRTRGKHQTGGARPSLGQR